MNELTLKQTRLSFGLTQKETAEAVDMPIRTYIRYETDDNYGNRLKRKAAIGVLNDRYAITEDKGVLTQDFIASTIKKLLEKNTRIRSIFVFFLDRMRKDMPPIQAMSIF